MPAQSKQWLLAAHNARSAQRTTTNLYLVFKTVEFSIQSGYYEKVQDVIDALYKAGLSNLTDVVLSYDDASKRVTVKCGRHVVVKLRGI